MFAAMSSDTFTYPFPTKIYVPHVYSTCRHPMQAGILCVIVFSNPNYTLGRFVLTAFLLLGQFIGVLQEEKTLMVFPEYREYTSIVTNRYIPNFLNWFNGIDKKLQKKE
jgi:protein-S-isoprenylcysteine O-methyltransferase Ste14